MTITFAPHPPEAAAVILSARGPKRFLQWVPNERSLLFGAELGGGKRRICFFYPQNTLGSESSWSAPFQHLSLPRTCSSTELPNLRVKPLPPIFFATTFPAITSRPPKFAGYFHEIPILKPCERIRPENSIRQRSFEVAKTEGAAAFRLLTSCTGPMAFRPGTSRLSDISIFLGNAT